MTQTSCPSATISPTWHDTDFTKPGIGEITCLLTSNWNKKLYYDKSFYIKFNTKPN